MYLFVEHVFVVIEKDNSYGHKVTSAKTCSLISTQEGSPFLNYINLLKKKNSIWRYRKKIKL